MKRYLVGIDPPKGFALYDRVERRLLRLETTDFWGLIVLLKNVHSSAIRDDNAVYIECPQYNKPVWFTNKSRASRKSFDVQLRVAQNVGMNKQCAKLLVEWCKDHLLDVVECVPGKRSITKMKAGPFNKLTGWTKQSSEHARDAAMLLPVWGI